MYQHIVVESDAKIYRKNRQLFIETDYAHHIPIEDVATLVLDNRKLTVTGFCLDSLIQNGTAVFICNEKHIPNGIMLPFAANSRRLKMIRLVLCQYLVQPKMKISPLHQLASNLECLQRALYNRSNSSGERKLQWLC
uniref:CRISPR-associated endonuclease Cas1 n=1 Tax=uncultured Veillonella sp. TaxID=159268 RepID=UPI002596BF9C